MEESRDKVTDVIKFVYHDNSAVFLLRVVTKRKKVQGNHAIAMMTNM